MRNFIILTSIIVAVGLQAPANAQSILESCLSQCQQTYDTRWAYCIGRYGGHNYDAEICQLGEYEILVDCQNNCYSQYGGQAALSKKLPRFMAKQISTCSV